MNNSYIYILTNKRNGTLYTGITNNIFRRLAEHKEGINTGFTSKYKLSVLVYIQEFVDINDAIAPEKTIKGWTREKKICLIENNNPDWKDLALDSSFHSE